MKYSDDLTSLSNEIFLGIDTNRTESENTNRQKTMGHFVIKLMFQMLVNVYRLYDVNYLPKDDISGWSNIYLRIFSSKTVIQQWKHSRFLYEISGCHSFIIKNGIINKPTAYLLNEMRKSHMITMIWNKNMTANELKNPNLVFNDIKES